MPKRILIILSLILFLSFFLANCLEKNNSIPALIENKEPIHILGNSETGPFYQFIWNYLIDPNNSRVYIWDYLNPEAIDAYDLNGKHLFTFGKRGSGPADFLALSNAAVDSSGNLWINDGNRKTLKVFSKNGEYIRNVSLPIEIQSVYIRKMIFNKYDELYLLGQGSEGSISIWKLDFGKNDQIKIYEEKQRKRISVVEFIPDIALDENSNLFITDSFDYIIHIFNREGKLIKSFSKKVKKKEPIKEEDFNIFGEGLRIIKFPGYKEILGQLTGPSKYFPSIFGINIDSNLIYVWTSEMDEQRRYIIDIYDRNFKKKAKACYFNFIKDNVAKIIDGKLYIPRIENYDLQVTKNLGRFSFFNSPDHLQVYAISKNILGL
ncbi:MAG: 6-bladed beta-propeller [Minisyncoccia bacterium]|nr:MAG: hypothetical protein C0168_11015 [Candidatus Aminicenantes bacterium]HEK86199.1 hypothetical protein [Candidatus Aminicenantes bacterium]